MHWEQLVFITDPDGVDPLSSALEAVGSSAVTLQDAADQPLFDTSQQEGIEHKSLWDQTRIIALFDNSHDPAEVITTLKKIIPALPPHEVLPLNDQDWERAWMSRFKPMRFGHANSAIWVCPSWETPPEPEAINLILDPGMAFGTGTHETTALCLEWLATSGQSVEHKRVIDYGCGSGILAIAAAKLGADKVWAIDIEQQALNSTLENAQANSVGQHLIVSGPDDAQHLQADLVIANILANPLIQLAPRFADFLSSGEILLSGIMADQVVQIIEIYSPWFSFQEPRFKNDWALLAGQRRTP